MIPVSALIPEKQYTKNTWFGGYNPYRLKIIYKNDLNPFIGYISEQDFISWFGIGKCGYLRLSNEYFEKKDNYEHGINHASGIILVYINKDIMSGEISMDKTYYDYLKLINNKEQLSFIPVYENLKHAFSINLYVTLNNAQVTHIDKDILDHLLHEKYNFIPLMYKMKNKFNLLLTNPVDNVLEIEFTMDSTNLTHSFGQKTKIDYISSNVKILTRSQMYLQDLSKKDFKFENKSLFIPIPGPRGPDGLGSATNTGATGPTGIGPTGIQGIIGPTGFTGFTGPTGQTGMQGIAGFTGPTGPQGISGTATNTGATGLQGVTGSTGQPGETGSTGSTGPTGVQGVIGLTGPTGSSSGIIATSAHIPGITLTAFGQPSLTNCTLNIQLLSIGSVAQVMLTLSINQTITTTALQTWSTPINTIPVNFLPSVILNYPVYIGASAETLGYVISYFYITPNGAIALFSPETNGTIRWSEISCIYSL